jgi:hypothetical protein
MREENVEKTAIPMLWAMVACMQISDVLSRTITHDVTRLLKQSGSADTAYAFQNHLENSKLLDQRLTGVTLDLIKCFNYQVGFLDITCFCIWGCLDR